MNTDPKPCRWWGYCTVLLITDKSVLVGRMRETLKQHTMLYAGGVLPKPRIGFLSGQPNQFFGILFAYGRV
jgi:hypothetical protein